MSAELAVVGFLSVFNVGLFVVSFLNRPLSASEISDYVIRRMLFVFSLTLFWVNFTFVRSIAQAANLAGYDLLFGMWIVFTILLAVAVLYTIWVTSRGAILLIEEVRKELRSGKE